MKTLNTLGALLFTIPALVAQEIVPMEEAQEAARKLVATSAPIADLPLKVEPDAEKPSAVKADKAGAMIIPAKGLSAEKLEAAADSPIPLGQLWSLRLSVAANGKAIESDKVRLVTVTDGEKQHELELYLVGARKGAQGALELVVFGKGNEPVARAPLAKRPASGTAQLPIELSGRKESDDTGTITLNLFGQYQADLPVARSVRE